jgi:hypothetical protein
VNVFKGVYPSHTVLHRGVSTDCCAKKRRRTFAFLMSACL